MKKTDLLVASKLLELAYEHFANHGCNDFDLAEVMPDVETRRDLVRRACEWDENPERFDSTDDYLIVDDSWLMGFLAETLALEAE